MLSLISIVTASGQPDHARRDPEQQRPDAWVLGDRDEPAVEEVGKMNADSKIPTVMASHRRNNPALGRLEQRGVSAAGRGHATHCQVANCDVNAPSSTADTTSARVVKPRSSHQIASHMNSGKTTAI